MTCRLRQRAFFSTMFFFVVCALWSGLALAQTVYHRGNTADPETLDPQKTSTTYEGHILRDLYEGLLTLDEQANLIPGVAQRWTVSQSGLVYTFTLRSDARWSNGDPVTAADFVYSFRRFLTPETGAKYAKLLFPVLNAEKVFSGKAAAEIIGVKALDGHTLEITLERPTPYFLDILTHQTTVPVHRASVQAYGPDFVRAENMVTNGAYTLSEFVPGSHIKLVKNQAFHDAEHVKIDAVVYYPTKDTSAAVRRFLAGELDSIDDIPADQVESLKIRLGDQVKLAPYLGIYVLPVSLVKPPLNDVRVRKALSLALDREFLAEQIWGGTMLPAYSFVPPGVDNYTSSPPSDEAALLPNERLETAKALLKQLGFGPDHPLRLTFRYNTNDNNRNTAVAIASMWQRIGVETTLLTVDPKTHFAYLRDSGGDFDVARYGWIGDYSDPQSFLFLLESDNKGFNYGKYSNSAYDALMKQAALEADLPKRAQILFQAETIFMHDLPWIPVMFYGSKNLVSPKLEGWSTNLKDVHPTRFLSVKP